MTKIKEDKDKKLKITLFRGKQGTLPNQRKVLEALGLRRTNHSVYHDDSPTIMGMLRKVHHLVKVEDNK